MEEKTSFPKNLEEMRKSVKKKELSDFITAAEAARIIGCSKSRIYQFINEERLSAVPIGTIYLLSREEVQTFRRGPTGRKRGLRSWKRYRNQDRLLATLLHVKVHPGMQEMLQEKLDTIGDEDLYILTGSVNRYFIEETEDLRQFVIVWRKSEMPDEALRQREMLAFQQALDDVLDWSSATIFENREVPLHT